MLGLKPIKTLPIREKIAANLREAILSKKFRRGNSDTGKYCAGTWSVHYTYKRSLSDSGKRWTSGTGAK